MHEWGLRCAFTHNHDTYNHSDRGWSAILAVFAAHILRVNAVNEISF